MQLNPQLQTPEQLSILALLLIAVAQLSQSYGSRFSSANSQLAYSIKLKIPVL
jgi:hypothetical protein